MARQHLAFLLEGRVADEELEQESVELGLGEGVRALVLDGVLRGDHDERVRERSARPLDRHLSLLHRLQQRRLRLGRRSVDFVRQEQVGEDRPLAKAQRSGSHLEHGLTGHIRWHEIGRELHAFEVHIERRGEGLHEQGLRHTRNPLQQHVPAHQQGSDQPRERPFLADDDLRDLATQRHDRVSRRRRRRRRRRRHRRPLPGLGIGWDVRHREPPEKSSPRRGPRR